MFPLSSLRRGMADLEILPMLLYLLGHCRGIFWIWDEILGDVARWFLID